MLGHRDTKNADRLGHRDIKNADNLGHRDTETVDIIMCDIPRHVWTDRQTDTKILDMCGQTEKKFLHMCGQTDTFLFEAFVRGFFFSVWNTQNKD